MSVNHNPLEDLFWRDEILQIAYWFQGEGLGQEVTAAELRRFLTDDAPALEPYLAQMVEEGLMAAVNNGRYRLTELGQREGARRFADAFENLTKPAHGDCSADCECHRTGNPEDCVNRKPQQAHVH